MATIPKQPMIWVPQPKADLAQELLKEPDFSFAPPEAVLFVFFRVT